MYNINSYKFCLGQRRLEKNNDNEYKLVSRSYEKDQGNYY